MNLFKSLILRLLNLGSKCPSVTISEHTQGGYSQKHPKRLVGAFTAKYGAFLNLGLNLIKQFSIGDSIPSKSDWFLLKIN